jgi:dTDP-4-amino-4,6-dideoxygalactose transaminase
VVSGLTCRVVPLAVQRAHAKIRYADIDAQTLNLDPELLAVALVHRPGAVLFQHTYGQSASLAPVAAASHDRGIPLIEDRAQLLPTSTGDPLTGVAAIYSNNLRKPLPAGSGGMVVTNDDQLASSLRAFQRKLPRPGLRTRAWHRVEWWLHDHWLQADRYWQAYRLHRWVASRQSGSRETIFKREVIDAEVRPSIAQEARGLDWLARTAQDAVTRRSAAATYRTALADLPGVELPCQQASDPLYYFPVLTSDKVRTLQEARRRRLEVVAWPISFPIYPVESTRGLSDLDYTPGQCPTAEWVAARLVGLPTRPGGPPDEPARIIDLVTDTSGKSAQ